jgi:very-short-patch-repair endonuclease
LRNAATEGERALWQVLRKRQIAGHRFRRQVAIGPFIADFACLERRVVIEVDGSSHDNPIRRQRDAERDAWIAAQRFRMLRLEDGEVLANPEAALDRIREFLGVGASSDCTTPTPTLPPSWRSHAPHGQGGGS